MFVYYDELVLASDDDTKPYTPPKLLEEVYQLQDNKVCETHSAFTLDASRKSHRKIVCLQSLVLSAGHYTVSSDSKSSETYALFQATSYGWCMKSAWATKVS